MQPVGDSTMTKIMVYPQGMIDTPLCVVDYKILIITTNRTESNQPSACACSSTANKVRDPSPRSGLCVCLHRPRNHFKRSLFHTCCTTFSVLPFSFSLTKEIFFLLPFCV